VAAPSSTGAFPASWQIDRQAGEKILQRAGHGGEVMHSSVTPVTAKPRIALRPIEKQSTAAIDAITSPDSRGRAVPPEPCISPARTERARPSFEKKQQVENKFAHPCKKGMDIAAIITEPIQGEGGDIISAVNGCKTLRGFAMKMTFC